MLAVLVLILLVRAADGACPPDIDLLPVELVVPHDDPLDIDCNALLRKQLGKHCVFTEGNNSLFVARNLTRVDWDTHARCNIQLNESLQYINLTFIVYKVPDNVSISLLNHSGPLVEGTEYHLQCDIQNVAPLRKLVVKWYKGNESLVNVTHSNHTIKTPVDVSPTLTITPSRDDEGAQYRCEAKLDLGPEGPQPPPTVSSEHQIHVEVPPQNQTTTFPRTPTTPGSRETSQSTVNPNDELLELNPPSVVVKYGDSVFVNCSTTSIDIEGMGWEVSVGGTDFQTNIRNVAWIVKNLTYWKIEPKCYITTSTKQEIKTLPVILYKTPDNVSISLQSHSGPLVEGTEYHLQCDIQNVAPLRKLVVKWYKGNEFLVNVTHSNHTIKTPVNVSQTLTITPSRDDEGAQYRCEAELDLGPEGPQPPPTLSSEPLNVTVHYSPVIKCPVLYSGEENHFTLDMTCVVMGNPPPDTVWFRESKPVGASEPLNRTESGLYNLTAINDQGSTNTSVEITVEYAPEWNCPGEYEIKENENLPSCKAIGLPTPEMSWFKDQKPVNPPRNWTRNNTGEYILVSNNKHGQANHTIVIDVLYAPEFLPDNGTPVMVRAGSNVSLGCGAEGNPPPVLKWTYTVADNVNVTTEGRQRTVRITRATSTNAGIFICSATNRVGINTRKTTVIITTTDYSTILLVTLTIVVLVILILLGYYCRWKKRQGGYNFHPPNNIQIMLTPQE